MSAIVQQLSSALTVLFYALSHLITFPFSKRARWRSLRLLAICQDPFVMERVPLSHFIPEPLTVSLGPLKSLNHNTSEYELLCLASMVKASGAVKIFEIGTFDGRSSRAMAMNLPTEGKLFTLNLPPGADSNASGLRNVDTELNIKVESGYRFADTPEAAKIQQLFGDSAAFDFSPYENQMDLVFIDGSHESSYVESDTQAALRMIRSSGGWIIWHDSTLYGVAPYLRRKIQQDAWPLLLIEGTTVMVGYCVNGKFTSAHKDSLSITR